MVYNAGCFLVGSVYFYSLFYFIFMLSIRLTRGGSKKKPVYDIVVAEKSAPRDGRFVETLGYSSPLQKAADNRLRVNLERYDYWAGIGAVPTPTVKRLVRDYRRQATKAAAQAEETADDAGDDDNNAETTEAVKSDSPDSLDSSSSSGSSDSSTSEAADAE